MDFNSRIDTILSGNTYDMDTIDGIYNSIKKAIPKELQASSVTSEQLDQLHLLLKSSQTHYEDRANETQNKNLLQKCISYFRSDTTASEYENYAKKISRRIRKVQQWQIHIKDCKDFPIFLAQRNSQTFTTENTPTERIQHKEKADLPLNITEIINEALIDDISKIDIENTNLGAYFIELVDSETIIIHICKRTPVTKYKRFLSAEVKIEQGHLVYKQHKANCPASFQKLMYEIQDYNFFTPIYTFPHSQTIGSSELLKITNDQLEKFQNNNPGQYKKRLIQISRQLYNLPNNKTIFATTDLADPQTVTDWTFYQLEEHGTKAGEGGFNKVKCIRQIDPFTFAPKGPLLTLSRPKKYNKNTNKNEYLCIDAARNSPSEHLDKQNYFAYCRYDGHVYHSIIRPYYPYTMKTYVCENSTEERQTLDLFRQACTATIDLHDLNFIHRDLKPSNYFVDANGTVILSDFGLVDPITTQTDPRNLAVLRPKGSKGYYPESMGLKYFEVTPIQHRKVDSYALYMIFFQLFSNPTSNEIIKLKEQLQGHVEALPNRNTLGSDIDKHLLLPEELLQNIKTILND